MKKTNNILVFLILLCFLSTLEVYAESRCQCSAKFFEGDCKASVKKKGNWITVSTNSNQCSRVDWSADDDPFITVVTDKEELEEWLGSSKSPKIKILTQLRDYISVYP